MKFLSILLTVVTVSQAAQVPQLYAPHFGYATTALDVLNPAIPATSYPFAVPYGYAFNGFPYNYDLPYSAYPFHFATPAVQAAFNPFVAATSAASIPVAPASAPAPAVIETKATLASEAEDDADVVEVDDTETILPDSSIPATTGPLTIRRIFPVFNDALKSAGNTLRFVSPTDLKEPVLSAADSPIISVRKETEDIPTPSVVTANNALRTETVFPVAPAGIVQATQPQFVASPFRNSVISPFLSSLINASPVKY